MTAPFMTLAKTVAMAEGVSDPCFVSVPHPFGTLPRADVRKKAEDAFPEILRKATEWRPSAGKKERKAAYPAERFEFTGSEADINRHFRAKGWSLGLPIIPPTSERVAEMLEGTHRKPDEVLGQAPPKLGTLTVELVAVSAVMAGCQPEYMPVLITALEAFLEPNSNWRAILATTATTQQVVIVNGPIIKELGIGCEQGAAGKGYHPNVSIGYAINLIDYVIGGSRPPTVDRSTFASPADCVCWVFGENEERLPAGWAPMHVDRGFKRSESTVTVVSTHPPTGMSDHWSTKMDDYVRYWRNTVGPMNNIGGPCNALPLRQNPIVVLSPEHANMLSMDGRSKSDFRKAFWEQVRRPLSAWPPGCTDMEKLIENVGPVTQDSMIPVAAKPEQILIVISGGDGKQSHYFAPFPGSFAVTRIIGK